MISPPSPATGRTARLLHWSSDPALAMETREQEPNESSCGKPRGLWVSVEGEADWPSWCESESFGDLAAQHCYVVELHPNANVLHLVDFLGFTRKYGFNPYAGKGYSFVSIAIDWPRVAAKYDGIIIAPYRWEYRHDHGTSWYYGWDCASGCIWNARAVASLTRIANPVTREPAEVPRG